MIATLSIPARAVAICATVFLATGCADTDTSDLDLVDLGFGEDYPEFDAAPAGDASWGGPVLFCPDRSEATPVKRIAANSGLISGSREDAHALCASRITQDAPQEALNLCGDFNYILSPVERRESVFNNDTQMTYAKCVLYIGCC